MVATLKFYLIDDEWHMKHLIRRFILIVGDRRALYQHAIREESGIIYYLLFIIFFSKAVRVYFNGSSSY